MAMFMSHVGSPGCQARQGKRSGRFLRGGWPCAAGASDHGLVCHPDGASTLESSMPFPTKPAVRHTLRVAWLRP